MFRILFYIFLGLVTGYFVERYLLRDRNGTWDAIVPPSTPPQPVREPEPADKSPAPTRRPTPPSRGEADDLTVIKGIGPTFAARLRAEGILRFEDLAAAAPDDLRRWTQIREWQRPGVDEWQDEARNLGSA